MFTDVLAYMAKNCIVPCQVQPGARVYALGNDEYIRVVNSLVGVRVFAVIDADKIAKLTFDDENLRMMVGKEAIYVDIMDRGERKKCLKFYDRDMELETVKLILRTLLELFPEHNRLKSVSG